MADSIGRIVFGPKRDGVTPSSLTGTADAYNITQQEITRLRAQLQREQAIRQQLRAWLEAAAKALDARGHRHAYAAVLESLTRLEAPPPAPEEEK